MAKNLFHYTDALAVKSILENQELWLSDIRFLNDSQEMNDGVKYILDVLSSELPDVGLDLACMIAARDYLNESFDDHISFGIDNEPTFVCSFSEAGNQLSQWRAYGGYSIEFDRELIDRELQIFECVYSESDKKTISNGIVRDAIRMVASDFQKYGAINSDSQIGLSMLLRTASTFKDQSFYEEQEVRCAVDLSLPSADLKFRSRSGILIPYIRLGFPFSAIKAIHIGPMRDQELAFTSMKSLVLCVTSEYASLHIGEVPDIEVVMSKTPFRVP